VYVEMPRGFAKDGKVLKLKKSLYGLKQAPRNFFLHLKSKLEAAGFTQSKSDPCLFISDTVICLVYVDDTLFFSPKKEYINEALAKLRATMEIEVEDDVAGFLGVHIKREEDGTIVLTQKGLIDRCIQALNIEHLPVKHTPAEYGCLRAHKGGEPAQGTYNYASVVGMLQYLVSHSRPDIMFAVSQCARYTHNPRRKHEQALERIGQYLKGTREQGLIMKPQLGAVLQIDAYVDADFAGMWGYEDKNDPTCVKSRTGYMIFIADCPVLWTSKLQGDIATCTMEAEYSALSTSMRDVLPLKQALMEIYNSIGLSQGQVVTFKTTVHEDNNGALRLATLEPGRSTPRSKHYAVKMHWFREKLKPNEIEIQKIDTKVQRADILTKSLRTDSFRDNRKLSCGW
jgi:Reverse transcriptase (RNA-dependent DNA polymerase)